MYRNFILGFLLKLGFLEFLRKNLRSSFLGIFFFNYEIKLKKYMEMVEINFSFMGKNIYKNLMS